MQLEELSIGRNNYGFAYGGMKAGEVGGKIKFSGAGGTVEVKLKPHHIAAILSVVAESMVSHTRELASELTTDIIEHAGATLQIEAGA